jgi:hypothetical protein
MRIASSSAHVLVLGTGRPAARRSATWPAAPAPAATPLAPIRGFDAPAAKALGRAVARSLVSHIAWPALTASAAGRRSAAAAVVAASMTAAAARSPHTTVHDCTGVFRRGFDYSFVVRPHSAVVGIITIYA